MDTSDNDKDLLADISSQAGAPVLTAIMLAASSGDPVVTTALAGTALSGFMQVAIGKLFRNRAERLIDDLVKKIDSMESEIQRLRGKERLGNETGQDLVLQGYLLAGISSDQQRIDHIVNILARGLTAEQLDHAETKKLLNLLSELDEVDIVVLQSFAGGEDFRKLHYEILKDSQNPWDEIKSKEMAHKNYRPTEDEIAEATEEIPRYVMYESRINYLVTLGLIGPSGSEHLGLTSLGCLLLHEIGFTSEKVRAQGMAVNTASLVNELRKERDYRRSARRAWL